MFSLGNQLVTLDSIQNLKMVCNLMCQIFTSFHVLGIRKNAPRCASWSNRFVSMNDFHLFSKLCPLHFIDRFIIISCKASDQWYFFNTKKMKIWCHPAQLNPKTSSHREEIYYFTKDSRLVWRITGRLLGSSGVELSHLCFEVKDDRSDNFGLLRRITMDVDYPLI